MRTLNYMAALMAAGTIAACGGGGGGGGEAGDSTASNVAGLWTGLTANGRQVSVLTFQDRSAWAMYTAPGGGNTLLGVVQGTLNGAATDFDILQVVTTQGTLTATVTPKQNISGTMPQRGSPGSTSFSATYDAAFEQSPNLAAIQGGFTGQAEGIGSEGTSLSVDSRGAITGVTIDGCNFTGTAIPRTDGNALNISMTFGGGSACALGTSTVTGVAYYDTKNGTLILAAVNSARSKAVVFRGAK